MIEALQIVFALIGGWLVPWLVMSFIMKRRFASGKQQTTNYAGKTVSYGLALVWPVWALTLLAFLVKSEFIVELLIRNFGPVVDHPLVLALIQVFQAYSFSNSFFVLAIPLVLSCFFFGWLDDRFGTRGDGGFKGHLKSLLRGKLTTGMIKVLGIGVTALVVAFFADGFRLTAASFERITAFDVLWIFLGMCAIALSANLINLFDLRPARASKIYLAGLIDTFVVVICITAIVGSILGMLNIWNDIFHQLTYVIWAAGPIFAIWRFDAGERAMLGDAGANPAGALMGLYAVIGLWILLPLYVVFVFIFNMLSEKFSFSEIIEAVPLFKKLDALGRPKV
ncbi:MAG: hypothetical protein FWE46_03475 [Coriobacteriia bacterium]|nr:hypothetical protein [Coriobacteriia bacterium]MCL2537556.1 hypothetical protein [Coriobacteriia bacterium]